ncbi:MAG: hypothetical protein R2849_14720 [Thermomicrobiales bacterium]
MTLRWWPGRSSTGTASSPTWMSIRSTATVVAASAELQAKTAEDELALSTPIVQLTREGKI